VYLEDLEAGDVQYADEILSLVLGIQCLVDSHDEPTKHTSVDGFRQSSYGVDNLQKHQTTSLVLTNKNLRQTRRTDKWIQFVIWPSTENIA